jgi:radical SAM superfamily enzyme YgiQ (UPF0313 family)
VNVLLISTYELGRQPFGLASPAAWLERAGARVVCLDLARDPLRADAVRTADLIAFYAPMHTATRLAVGILPQVRRLNSGAHLCFYGLYAPVNETYLRKLGAQTILGGEFEEGLAALARRLDRNSAPQEQSEPRISLTRLQFLVPKRAGLPPLSRYAHLNHPDGKPRLCGSTEASRGCKHLCRHCPIVPVYGGVFRIVQRDIVMEDIRRQVEAGAEHITFGDPDFFNGLRHALEIITALHREFPALTYDVTIKIEHLLKHAAHLKALRDTGCLFVTSAVESVDNRVLARLNKGHTDEDFAAVAALFREMGMVLSPTFVPFTPWTTLQGYCRLLERVAALGLIENVAPIQLAIRLLIPAGSRLLELSEIRGIIGPFDEAALVYPWAGPDPRVDELCAQVQKLVQEGEKRKESRRELFAAVWQQAHRAAGLAAPAPPDTSDRLARAAIPYLTEPWYC